MNDPAQYAKMCEPFESLEAANEAIQAFWKDFREIRIKHRLRDVVVIIGISAKSGDDDPQEALLTMNCGSTVNIESMCAYAFGEAKAEREEAIAKYLAGTATKKRSLKKENP